MSKEEQNCLFSSWRCAWLCFFVLSVGDHAVNFFRTHLLAYKPRRTKSCCYLRKTKQMQNSPCSPKRPTVSLLSLPRTYQIAFLLLHLWAISVFRIFATIFARPCYLRWRADFLQFFQINNNKGIPYWLATNFIHIFIHVSYSHPTILQCHHIDFLLISEYYTECPCSLVV